MIKPRKLAQAIGTIEASGPLKKQIPTSNSLLVAQDFLSKLIPELCYESCRYFDLYSDYTTVFKKEGKPEYEFPLFLSEKYNYSLFANSLSRVSQIYMSEAWVGRQSKQNKSGQGSVDFWCVYNSREILLELKMQQFPFHNQDNKNSKPQKNESLEKFWKKIKEQTNSLEEGGFINPIRIGLGILPFRSNLAKNPYEGKIGWDKFKKIELIPETSWSALWTLPEIEAIRKYKDISNSKKSRFYPAIGFIAHIEK